MEIINILADHLAKSINISLPATKGLLKLAIKDQLGPFKSLYRLDFEDLKNTVYNSLKQRLINLGIPNIDSLIEGLYKQLIEKQSLITLSKI